MRERRRERAFLWRLLKCRSLKPPSPPLDLFLSLFLSLSFSRLSKEVGCRRHNAIALQQQQQRQQQQQQRRFQVWRKRTQERHFKPRDFKRAREKAGSRAHPIRNFRRRWKKEKFQVLQFSTLERDLKGFNFENNPVERGKRAPEKSWLVGLRRPFAAELREKKGDRIIPLGFLPRCNNINWLQ